MALSGEHRELGALKRRIATLTEEARRNEEAWRRSLQREMALLEAPTLGVLLERLTTELRDSFNLEAATLVLADPTHEVRHLLMVESPPYVQPPGVLFVDSLHGLAPSLANGRPWLGPFRRADHELLFSPQAPLGSVALLPLMRRERLVGSLNLGSRDPSRFGERLATDFLDHLAMIAAFCLESSVNRARLVRSGLTDVLTGWHNRRYLQTRLHEELARCRREGTALTCLMIDVDRFKPINDLYGHLAGDEALRQVAQCIDAEVRDSDVSARYGGEEFVILLPRTDAASGHRLAERIRAAVAAERFELPGAAEPLAITVSIGVAEHKPSSGADDLKLAGQELIARADLALYEAKAAGRNAVVSMENR